MLAGNEYIDEALTLVVSISHIVVVVILIKVKNIFFKSKSRK